MSWEKIKLQDCCISISDGDHQSIPLADSGIAFIVISDIVNNRILFDKVRFVPEEYYDSLDDKRKPRKGDVLLTVKGTFGIPVYVNDDVPFVFQRDIAIFKCKNNINSRYLYYCFKHPMFYKYADLMAIGAAQRALTLGTLRNTTIYYPPLDIQKRIVEVLSAYDDLIENNQKQIKLLEEAAQRLYKEWFVNLRFPGCDEVKITDGVPEGWFVKSMEDIADYMNGYAFKPSDWGNRGKPIIKIKELNEGVTKNTPRNIGDDIPEKYNVYPGDIIFSWSATLTAKIWDDEEGLLNQHLFKVIPCDGFSREYVLQSILKTLDEFRNLTTGSTMKHIQRGKLKQVFVKVPSPHIMEEYENYSDTIRQKILILNHKIILLQEARDRLLPKLMSGEIEL